MDPGEELVDVVDEGDQVIDVVTRAEMRAGNLMPHNFEGSFERALMRLYEVTWDGPISPQPEEIAWGGFVTVSALDRMLREEEFCPDSVALFELWRDGRLDP